MTKQILHPMVRNLPPVCSLKSKFERPCGLVAMYQKNELGETVLVPTPEHSCSRVPHDGTSFELSSLMYGTLPETLAQVSMLDPMDTAQHITSECVRRFGQLEKQRAELEKQYSPSNE